MTDQTIHTPGKWVAQEVQEGHFRIYEQAGLEDTKRVVREIAEVDHHRDGHEGFRAVTTPANAYLIAAAPEMYEFIESIENDLGLLPDFMVEMREKVLKKARGEP